MLVPRRVSPRLRRRAERGSCTSRRTPSSTVGEATTLTMSSRNPINVYARTKRGGEVEALRLPSALVARFNVVGRERLAYWILSNAARGQVISVFTDVFFNPVETGDLARLLWTLCECGLTGVCHLGSDEVVSKSDFAERLIRYAGLAGRARLQRSRLTDSAMRAPRPLNTSLRVSRRVLDVAPPPSLDAAVRRLAASIMDSESLASRGVT